MAQLPRAKLASGPRVQVRREDRLNGPERGARFAIQPIFFMYEAPVLPRPGSSSLRRHSPRAGNALEDVPAEAMGGRGNVSARGGLAKLVSLWTELQHGVPPGDHARLVQVSRDAVQCACACA